jgi:hypothetical protein
VRQSCLDWFDLGKKLGFVTYAMGRLEGVADIAWVSVRPHHGSLLKRPKREEKRRCWPSIFARRFICLAERPRIGSSHRTPHSSESSPMTLPPPILPARYDMPCSRSAVHIPDIKRLICEPSVEMVHNCDVTNFLEDSMLPLSNLRTIYSHSVMWESKHEQYTPSTFDINAHNQCS